MGIIMEEIIIEDLGGDRKVIFDNNTIWLYWHNERTYEILRKVPKTNKGRMKLILKIEQKAQLNSQNCKVSNKRQCENFLSIRNRYERQWTYLKKLMGLPVGDFGDVLA